MAPNYLPFDLPPEICELIFHNLKADEILKSMLVSTTWHDFIVDSARCFAKVVLTVDEDTDLESVLQSERSYQTLSLLKVRDYEKLISVLQTLRNAIKKVVIFDCCRSSCEGEIVQQSFQCLQELTLSNVSCNVLQTMTSFHPNLTTLNLHNLSLKQGTEPIVSLLKLNTNLKEINCYLNESCNIFQEDISSMFAFNLASITISFKSNFEIDERTLTNVEKFLISQGDTLRTIGLINAASLFSLQRIWNFLTSVDHVNFFSADSLLDLESTTPTLLKANFRMESLEIHILGPFPISVNELQPFLKATKNLKSLGVWNLTNDLVEYSAMNLTRLENLFCATMEKDCESFYEQLKTKSGINKRMKLHQYL